MIKSLKKELYKRFGHKDHECEWDGTFCGGGKGSQRFWEYLWALDQIAVPYWKIIDIGCGNKLFLYNILKHVFKYNVYAVDPEVSEQTNVFKSTLEEYLKQHTDRNYDTVFCISVLEHIDDRESFCKLLDEITGRIIITFELTYSPNNKYITRKQMYSFLNVFEKHYVSKINKCPVIADNSNGTWHPMGVVLDVM